MVEILINILRNSILVTGLVVVMMMMIESLNIESHGMLFKGLKKTKVGQVVFGALLGSIPGCMGGFATVSLYTHGMFSFGALVAMMIASSGDEAFVMMAMIPDKALLIFTILFVTGVVVGLITDFIHDRMHIKKCDKADHSDCGEESKCDSGYAVHEENVHKDEKRHFGWKRIVMLVGLCLFITALLTGYVGHDHSGHSHPVTEHSDCHEGTCIEDHGHHHHGHHEHDSDLHFNVLSEEWMHILFAGLSLIVLVVLLRGSDHFIEEHLWNHIVKKHLPSIFAWTFGVLLVVTIALQYFDIGLWISDNTALMILLATLIGIIPESGPHMIFVTLYATGLVPFPVLLASSISQDGHASLPLIAESRKAFLWAKAINCIVALLVGYSALLLY